MRPQQLLRLSGVAQSRRPFDVGRLHPDGLVLRREDGSAYFGVGITAFPLLQYWLDGHPKVWPFLDFCERYGVFPRFTGSYESLSGLGIGSFHPYHYGIQRVQDAVRSLASELERRNSRGKLDACADVQNGSLDGHSPASYFFDLGEAAHGITNLEVTGGNEAGRVPPGWKNGWDPATLYRPSDVLCSRGSNCIDELPPEDPWDSFDVHLDRDENWPKAAKAIYDIQVGQTSEGIALRVPGGFDEMIGVGEVAEEGKTTNNPDDVFDTFAAPFGSYGVVHARTGATLDIPGPVATQCVEAAVEAAKLMPPEFREGQYVRGGLGLGLVNSPQDANGENLWWLRAYGRQRGDEQWITIQRPRYDRGLVVQAAPGWTIVEQRGNRRNIVHVKRG